MNKYQEAIEFFRKLATRIPCEKYDNNYLTLKELVDKATLKKPKLPTDDFREIWNCPNCNAVEMDYHQYNYCPSCGQAIDWSDENV